ncbi:MAG: hypothetical protein ACKKL4_01055 [Patescibacteria group bacterium]
MSEQMIPPHIPDNTNRAPDDRHLGPEQTSVLDFSKIEILDLFHNRIISNILSDVEIEKDTRDYIHHKFREILLRYNHITIESKDGKDFLSPQCIQYIKTSIRNTLEQIYESNRDTEDAQIKSEFNNINKYVSDILTSLERGIPQNVVKLS